MIGRGRRLVVGALVALAGCRGNADDALAPSAPIGPTTPATSALVIESGADQRGLIGRPLAESLTVRLRTAAGAPVANAAVAWAGSGGTLSAASTTTRDDGTARVQFTPTSATATVTASAAGLSPASFMATARGGGICTLTPSTASQRLSLGPTDFTVHLRGTAPLRIAVLFVDYLGTPATETPAALMSSVVEPGLTMLREISYGRFSVAAVAFPTWYRMPRRTTDYDWSTAAGHRQFLADVVSVTDGAIDFSTFDALYVFGPPNAQQPTSLTYSGGTSGQVVADGRAFGNAVTFGADARRTTAAGVAHETLHMLGLPDLQSFVPLTTGDYAGQPFQFVGNWSLMSNVAAATHPLIWEKRKLGWVDESQVDCLDATGGVESVLTPNGTPGGRKAVIVPVDASRALVIEARALQGLDATLCAGGLLLYEVDARTLTGQGPVRVLGARATTSGALFERCGPWADGTFGSGATPVLSATHAPTAASITVLGTDPATGAVRVRVRR